MEKPADDCPIPILLALACRSAHPLARCLADSLSKNVKLNGISLTDEKILIDTRPGRGMIAWRDESKSEPLAILGSPTFMEELHLPIAGNLCEELQKERAEGRSILIFADCQNHLKSAIFSFDESLRPDSRQAIELLKNSSVKYNLSILTGDHTQAAGRLADRLGIAFQAELLPRQKQEIVASARIGGHRVAFVGEGYN
ncbi:MAG: HAD family hydrolase, partial [bacterium]